MATGSTVQKLKNEQVLQIKNEERVNKEREEALA